MRTLRRQLALVVPYVTLTYGLAAGATPSTLERELRFDASRFSVVQRQGETAVEMSGAGRELTPGQPDLPVLGESIELPEGVRVTGVEVLALETAVLSEQARVPPAIRPSPELGPIVRTSPDPAAFGRSGFLPVASHASVGYQGWMRGKHLVWLKLSPVRWDPATGRLERVTRMTVRLSLEPGHDDGVVRRERIVPEWEEGAPKSLSTSGAGGGGRAPQPFKAQQLPSVLGSPVAYVIVTSDAMAAEFQRLADWKTQSGVPAVVRTMSFIRSQYPSGTDDADRIRLFLRDAYARWSTKWVLLGGDTDVIPYRTASTILYGGDQIPSDLYYSCLDGNWNADGDATYGEPYEDSIDQGDAADLMPEVYVGRAPVSSAADAQRFVDKTFQYTRTPVGDYENLVSFFAEVLFPVPWDPQEEPWLDGAELVEELLPSLQANPGIHYLRMYQNYTDPRWSPGSLPESKAAVLDSLNAGYNMAVHVGHGYRNVMSVNDGNIENADMMALTNGNRLTNLYSTNCTSNAIDFPSIGEAFIRAPNGGGVTNIGSTRLDFPDVGRAFQKKYFQLVFQDSVTAVGEAQAKQKLPWVGLSSSDNLFRWIEVTLLLLGDPELRQWTARPRTLTVTHPAFALNDTTMTVNVKIAGVPLYGARVTLYKANEDYRSVTTNGAGNAVLDFRPSSTGTYTLTVTGFNCRPVQETLTVGASATAAFADLSPVIVDTGAGTIGNADGQFDAGETVDLRVPIINRGAGPASGVIGVISSTDPTVTIVDSDVTYGTVAAGLSAQGGLYRLILPASCPDQRELPFTLSLVDDGNRHYVQRFTLIARAPDARQTSHQVLDPSPGNSNGIAEVGEQVSLLVNLRNLGTGRSGIVTAKLRNYDGFATVSDSTASFGDIAAGAEATGDALVTTMLNGSAKLELRISGPYGLLFTQKIDLVPPAPPTGLNGAGSQNAVVLKWTPVALADLSGYNVYRASAVGGPYTRITMMPTDRSTYYQDEGLSPLTRYYYKVTAVDSSANESGQSTSTSVSTTPPNHAVFPVEMRRSTPAPVAVDRLYSPATMDIAAGADVLWLWHADGSAPVDADGQALSHGDFTTRGSYYAAGPSLAKLDHLNWSVIAPSWDSLAVYVFDTAGNVRPGWPFPTPDPVWSGVAVGDLNNDGSEELVFASNGARFYALRANGTEWRDGDNNPGTQGVFKVLSGVFNYGTPGIADVDRNSVLDIVYASADGNLYAWRPDGTDLPGFPVGIGSGTSSSVAMGYLDGLSDTQLDIVVASKNDSLYVFKSDGGRRAGFPVEVRFQGVSKSPSPALADMNADGFVDVVVASTDGKIYVFNRNGALNANFANARYSAITDGSASESSPVVADIDGDTLPDVVMGDEAGTLNALSAFGQPLPGFPIALGGEVRGVPALCDCDGDGLSEIVVSSWDQNTYVWDYDFAYSPSRTPPWPQFHHDARRTGLSSSSVSLDAPAPGSGPLPPVAGLAAPVPSVARAATHIAWAVPAERAGADFDLAIYDLTGRRIAGLASGKAELGRFEIDWQLRSDQGAAIGTGIYFVRLRLGAFIESRKLVVMR